MENTELQKFLLALDNRGGEPSDMIKEVSRVFGFDVNISEIEVKKFLGVIDV